MLKTAYKLPRTPPNVLRRFFHPTPVNMVKVGDSIPSVDLVESSPGDKVNVAKLMTGKGLIIGVPAAFSESIGSSTYLIMTV